MEAPSAKTPLIRLEQMSGSNKLYGAAMMGSDLVIAAGTPGKVGMYLRLHRLANARVDNAKEWMKLDRVVVNKMCTFPDGDLVFGAQYYDDNGLGLELPEGGTFSGLLFRFAASGERRWMTKISGTFQTNVDGVACMGNGHVGIGGYTDTETTFHDATDKPIVTLPNEQGPGNYTAEYDAQGVPSGAVLAGLGTSAPSIARRDTFELCAAHLPEEAPYGACSRDGLRVVTVTGDEGAYALHLGSNDARAFATGGLVPHGVAVASAPNDEAVVALDFTGKIEIDGTAFTPTPGASLSTMVMIVTPKKVRWSRQVVRSGELLPSAGGAFVHGLVIVPHEKSFYLVGMHNGDVKIGDQSISVAESGIFVAELTP